MVLTFAVTPFKHLAMSVFQLLRLASLSFSPLLSYATRCYRQRTSSPIRSVFLALSASLTGNSNPKLPFCSPLFTSLPACILTYITKERGPALLIRSMASLKGIRRERWRYALHSTCPPCPPTELVINDVSHIRGALSDMDSPTKQSQG